MKISKKEFRLRCLEKYNNRKLRYPNKENFKSSKRSKIKKTKEELKECNRNRSKERRKKDIQFRLAHNLRSRLQNALKRNQRIGSAVRDLGCSINKLKQHLESLFQPGMTWENYGIKEGQWSIDHIISLSSVNLQNKKEFLKVNNYKNLRPMWHKDNIKKFNHVT